MSKRPPTIKFNLNCFLFCRLLCTVRATPGDWRSAYRLNILCAHVTPRLVKHLARIGRNLLCTNSGWDRRCRCSFITCSGRIGGVAHCEKYVEILKCELHQEGVDKTPWISRSSGFCGAWHSFKDRRSAMTEICSGKHTQVIKGKRAKIPVQHLSAPPTSCRDSTRPRSASLEICTTTPPGWRATWTRWTRTWPKLTPTDPWTRPRIQSHTSRTPSTRWGWCGGKSLSSKTSSNIYENMINHPMGSCVHVHISDHLMASAAFPCSVSFEHGALVTRFPFSIYM